MIPSPHAQFRRGSMPHRITPRPYSLFHTGIGAQAQVATPSGPRAANTLAPGDLIQTTEGPRPLLDIRARRVAHQDLYLIAPPKIASKGAHSNAHPNALRPTLPFLVAATQPLAMPANAAPLGRHPSTMAPANTLENCAYIRTAPHTEEPAQILQLQFQTPQTFWVGPVALRSTPRAKPYIAPDITADITTAPLHRAH